MEKENVAKLVECYNDFISDLSYKKDITNEDYSEEEEQWSKTPLEKLEGKSPDEKAAEIILGGEAEEIEELYRYVTDNVFWYIPSFVKNIMVSSGEKGVECIRKILENGRRFTAEGYFEKMDKDEFYDYECFVTTVRLAPDMKSEILDSLLIEMFTVTAEEEEILDTFENAFIKTDCEKLFPLLEREDISENKKASVCQAIVSSGKKSDEIFGALKKAFKKAENKELIGMMLSDYGDGRAVPVLRKEMIKLFEIYVGLPANSEERNTVFQAMMLYNNFITSLGGNTDDIMK